MKARSETKIAKFGFAHIVESERSQNARDDAKTFPTPKFPRPCASRRGLQQGMNWNPSYVVANSAESANP